MNSSVRSTCLALGIAVCAIAHAEVKPILDTRLRLESVEQDGVAQNAEALLLEHLAPGDVLTADYHLDGKNTGLDLLLRLRERVGYEVPGVVLSGDLPYVLRSIKSPVVACHFLSKPVTPRRWSMRSPS